MNKLIFMIFALMVSFNSAADLLNDKTTDERLVALQYALMLVFEDDCEKDGKAFITSRIRDDAMTIDCKFKDGTVWPLARGYFVQNETNELAPNPQMQLQTFDDKTFQLGAARPMSEYQEICSILKWRDKWPYVCH